MKIIIADQSPSDLLTLKEILEGMSTKPNPIHICAAVTNGIALIEKVRDHWPVDLVLTGVDMPAVDGLTALIRLKSELFSFKLVFISSKYAPPPKERRAHKSIFNAHNKDLQKMENIDHHAKVIVDRKKETVNQKSILEYSQNLGARFFNVAEYYGALGHIEKPVTEESLTTLFDELSHRSDFIIINNVQEEVEIPDSHLMEFLSREQRP